MTMLLMFLRRYWRVLVVAAAVAALLAYASAKINGAIEDADRAGYQRARGEYEALVVKANAEVAARDAEARKRIHEVENAHQKALSDLDARYAVSRVPAVRLCREPARGGELPGSPGSTALDPGAAGADRFPGGAAPDVGPRLERLVRAADEQTQRLIACQAFVSSLK